MSDSEQQFPVRQMPAKSLPPSDMPDYENMSESSKDQYRIHFRIMFGRMREMYPTYSFPTFHSDTSLYTIHEYYDIYQRHIAAKTLRRNILMLCALLADQLCTQDE